MLGFTIGLRTVLDIVILCVFVCFGLARLARFNVTTHLTPKDANGKSKYFAGLPIPTSLALVLVMWTWAENGHLSDGVPFGTILNGRVHVFSIVWLGWAMAMVSNNLRIPKI